MAEASGPAPPSLGRVILAALAVLLIVLAVWKTIDYRMRPPPPTHALPPGW